MVEPLLQMDKLLRSSSTEEVREEGKHERRAWFGTGQAEGR